MIKNFQRLSLFKKSMILLVFVVVGLGITGYYYTTSNIESSTEVSEDAIVPEESSETDTEEEATVVEVESFNDIGSLVSNYHGFYNKTLGWGKYKSVNEQAQLKRVESLLKDLDDINTEDEVEDKDIKHIKQLAQIYIKTKNTDALLYLHRVFHDLDKAVNEYKHKDTFGATYTLGKRGFFGNQLNDIKNFIDKNQE